MSNHEIDQTFVSAMQSAVRAHKLASYTPEDAKITMDELHTSVKGAQEMSELLGQPLTEEVLDEDLEQEFLEVAGVEDVTLPSAVVAPVQVAIPPPRVLTTLVAA